MKKYELMGEYMEVKAYLKPAKKFSARSHEPIILGKPRVGMVVGYRTVYDGKIHPGRQGYEYDCDPPYFEVTGKIQVLLVCFWPRYKPVLVKPEDAVLITCASIEVTNNLHPTICPWSDKDKAWLREVARDMPRDEKGRWLRNYS